jgi:hypothetical protein
VVHVFGPIGSRLRADRRTERVVDGAGAVVTAFSTIADAPVSKFTLKISGGPKASASSAAYCGVEVLVGGRSR